MSDIKYLAFLDILGFKELIENNKLDQLEKLYKRLEGSLLYSFAVTNPQYRFYNGFEKIPGIEETNLNSLIISDSIIIWTDDDSQGSFFELVLAVKFYMYFSMESGFPLRGAISHGELIIKSGKRDRSPKVNSFSTILGQALTQAYLLESKSEWSGCVIDDKSIDYFNNKLKKYDSQRDRPADLKAFEELDILRMYKAPFKSGPVKEFYTINWTHYMGPRLTVSQITKAFKAHNKKTDDWTVQSKIKNTIQYFNDTADSYKMFNKLMRRKTPHNKRFM